ncbi:type IV pilus assembly protein PilM [Rosistilla oblonga]|uniref:Competence protein A n=1 Tax=Rosistilla oblonga TaxID=2527990 RepID=A0A518J1P3_9BACT|nr:type IV pilus assembly protein PilM [Rosistilla oblonga]QDV59255.1 Competence protein A [Rosistilla oblonga]
MASNASVWGIEVGQTALKALRCEIDGGEVVANAFDYIEYPKILSHPEADPEELVRDALQTFLERNETRGYRVAVSVPGQSGLSKFFKPPPVEAKKVGDIVRYEARQQIPFDLDDVVWDFQMMPGSTIEEGYALETEVGLFAMKRDQVYKQLKPFDTAELEVDLIQLAPIAMYNMLAYDRMNDRLEANDFDVENPPTSTVMVSLGTDSTDLIISNGFRVWQRSMPLGGNHFTRQLTKDLKMTFAKAEHLKRNTRDAEDPKLIIQTMRPVFNDLVTEIQRSIGFFQSIHKEATIDKLLLTGNTVKLPGLGPYLGKNLGYTLEVLDGFQRLQGPEVLSSPVFKENQYTFGVCYGLCLQALGLGPIETTLVPKEILTDRIIRAKKPWALACAAALMAGFVGHYLFVQRDWSVVREERWSSAISQSAQPQSYATTHKSTDSDYISKLAYLKNVGQELSGNGERRLIWIEFLTMLDGLMPHHPDYQSPSQYPSPLELPYSKRPDIYIDSIETQYFDDLSEWYTDTIAERYRLEMRNWFRITRREQATEEQRAQFEEELMALTGPEGPGWVVELKGFHYYNDIIGQEAGNHVRKYLTENFLNGAVNIPLTDSNNLITPETFTTKEMGISYPLLLNDPGLEEVKIPNPEYEGAPAGQGGGMMAGAMMGGGGQASTNVFGEVEVAPKDKAAADDGPKQPPSFEAKKYAVTFQFCWQPKSRSLRLQLRAEAEAEAAALAEEEAAAMESEEPANEI